MIWYAASTVARIRTTGAAAPVSAAAAGLGAARGGAADPPAAAVLTRLKVGAGGGLVAAFLAATGLLRGVAKFMFTFGVATPAVVQAIAGTLAATGSSVVLPIDNFRTKRRIGGHFRDATLYEVVASSVAASFRRPNRA